MRTGVLRLYNKINIIDTMENMISTKMIKQKFTHQKISRAVLKEIWDTLQDSEITVKNSHLQLAFLQSTWIVSSSTMNIMATKDSWIRRLMSIMSETQKPTLISAWEIILNTTSFSR